MQNITWGKYRKAQSLAKDIIRTPRESAEAFCFCRLQYQFQSPHHCQTLVFSFSGRRGHQTHLDFTSLSCPTIQKAIPGIELTLCEVHLCFSQVSHMYTYNMIYSYIYSCDCHFQFSSPLSVYLNFLLI